MSDDHTIKDLYNDIGQQFLSMFDDHDSGEESSRDVEIIYVPSLNLVAPPPPNTSPQDEEEVDDGEFANLNGRSLEKTEKEPLPEDHRKRRLVKRKRHLDMEEEQRIAKKRKLESAMKRLPEGVHERKKIHQDIFKFLRKGEVEEPEDLKKKKTVNNYRLQQIELKKRKLEKHKKRDRDLAWGMYEKGKSSSKTARDSNRSSKFKRFGGGGVKQRQSHGILQLSRGDVMRIHGKNSKRF